MSLVFNAQNFEVKHSFIEVNLSYEALNRSKKDSS